MISGTLRALLAVLAILYPVLVYVGIGYFRPGVFGLLLAVIVILRLTGLSSEDRRQLLVPTTIAFVYAVAVALSDNATLLRFYPAMINAMMLLAFGRTLLDPPSLIERALKARGTDIDEEGRIYVRHVTAVWCVFFAINGSIAIYTALYSSWQTWALYNGILAYIAMGALFCIELIVRHIYRSRVESQRRADG